MSEPLSEGERDLLRDWWDEETTASVESVFPILDRIVAARERKAAEAAWDEGFMYAAGQDHPAYPRTRRMTNPYGAQ
ncbi:MAG: hypothetical protein H0X12_13505 [Nocardioides sp.]|nr:hypothetical protein [Nocardioides sp.]